VTNALQRATGSGAFVAVARSVFLVGAHPEDNDLPLKDQRRIFASAKPNLAGPVPSRSFRIHESEDKIGRFVWEGETSASARDVMVAEMGGSGQDGKLEHAVEWLKAGLASGPQQAAGLHDRAEAAGISHKTLQRASKLLDVVKQQQATAGKQFWTWHLPDTPEPLKY